MYALMTGEAGLSTTRFTNVHWYQVIPATELAPVLWLERQVGKQVMFNEIGTYSEAGSDVMAALTAAAFLGAPEAIWWNQDIGASLPGPPHAAALQNPSTGVIQSNGVAFKTYIKTYIANGSYSQPVVPDAVSTPFAAQPPC